MPIRVTVDRVAEIRQAADDLAGKRVAVGIPATSAGRSDGPLNNAEIGYIMENGAPEVNIPARPHLVPTVRDMLDPTIVPRLRKAGEAAFAGDAALSDRILNGLGLDVASAVKDRIVARIPPPLADRTIAARIARGRTGTVPLLDTGKYLAAITYVILKKLRKK